MKTWTSVIDNYKFIGVEQLLSFFTVAKLDTVLKKARQLLPPITASDAECGVHTVAVCMLVASVEARN